MQTDTRPGWLSGAATVIANQQAQMAAVMLQANPHLTGAGVTADVGQGFLQQAVEMSLVRCGQRRQLRADPQLAIDPLPTLPLLDQQAKGFGQ